MRPNPRRRNRLRSAQYVTERWRPPTAAVVLVLGLAVGVILGLTSRASADSANVQQHYLLLVSDLYAQGVPLASVRDRLISLGYRNPSVAVLAAADQLAHSRDAISQQEADQLHQFAEALVAGPESETGRLSQSTGSTNQAVVQQPLAQAQVTAEALSPSPTPMVSTPVVEVAVLATTTPVPTDLASPTATLGARPNTAAATPAPSPTPEPRSTPAATPAPEKPGIVRTSGHQPALLRSGPTTKSAAVAIVPDGAKVAVYGILRGEALEPPEARWYHVVYNGRQGYLYFKLVQVGG